MKRCNYYYSSAETKWAGKIILFSLAITLSIFLFLPFSELFLQHAKKLTIRSVKSIALTRTTPKKPEQLRKIIKRRQIKPRLVKAGKKLTPLNIEAALPIAPASAAGDFILDSNFVITPEFSRDNYIFELYEVDTPPQPFVRIHPLYPITARMRGIEGKVVLLFTVTADGLVENVIVQSSNPGTIFVSSAVNAVKKWRFKPATKNKKPVAVKVSLPLKFEMQSRL